VTGDVGSSMPVRGGWVLFAVVLGSGVVFLDSTVVNVALQTIGQDLPAVVALITRAA
jgi:hypothetical protein